MWIFYSLNCFEMSINLLVCVCLAIGVSTSLAGGSGSANGLGTVAKFHSPQGIAYAIPWGFYISDSNNNNIRKMTTTGNIRPVFKPFFAII